MIKKTNLSLKNYLRVLDPTRNFKNSISDLDLDWGQCMYVLSLSLSLLFPIILYSTYSVLQCNEFGRKTKETLTGFYK